MFEWGMVEYIYLPLLKYFGSAFFAAAKVVPNPTNAEIPAIEARKAPAKMIMVYMRSHSKT